MLLTPRNRLAILLVVCFVWAPTVFADAYADARRELVRAYQGGNFSAMRIAAQRALAARPGYPGALFNLALAEVLDGDPEAALGTLLTCVSAGADFGVADIAEFAPLRSLPGWRRYQAAVQELNEPVGTATVAYTYDVGDFVPEGIAIGNGGELYLGSIRHGTIVRSADEATVISNADGHWSVFGMRLDGRGGLWFASASVPEYAGDNADPGRTGLFRLDLTRNEVDTRALLPQADAPRVLGDLVITDDDTIYTTESLTGVLYRYSISRDEFTEIGDSGTFQSLQGLTVDGTGEHLYVADYVRGLFRVSLADNRVHSVASGNPWSFGIDGLYYMDGGLIAIQNGARPHRVVGLDLSDNGLDLEGGSVIARNLPEYDEPTLGVLVGTDFYYVANSHWNRFDAEHNLPEGLRGPIVLKLSLE